MMGGAWLENEIKLHLEDEAAARQILSDPAFAALASGQPQIFSMHTLYLDTPGNRLREQAVMLRVRRENNLSVASLKLAGERNGAGLFRRPEWSLAIPDSADWQSEALLDQLLQKAGRELLERQPFLSALLGEPLHVVAEARFQRTALPIRYGGAALEAAFDVGQLSAGQRELAFAELEVELDRGPLTALTSLSVWLMARFLLRPEKDSKYGRALGLLEA